MHCKWSRWRTLYKVWLLILCKAGLCPKDSFSNRRKSKCQSCFHRVQVVIVNVSASSRVTNTVCMCCDEIPLYHRWPGTVQTLACARPTVPLGLWSITSSLRGNLYVPRLQKFINWFCRPSQLELYWAVCDIVMLLSVQICFQNVETWLH